LYLNELDDDNFNRFNFLLDELPMEFQSEAYHDYYVPSPLFSEESSDPSETTLSSLDSHDFEYVFDFEQEEDDAKKPTEGEKTEREIRLASVMKYRDRIRREDKKAREIVKNAKIVQQSVRRNINKIRLAYNQVFYHNF
jgi:hypothetical protein